MSRNLQNPQRYWGRILRDAAPRIVHMSDIPSRHEVTIQSGLSSIDGLGIHLDRLLHMATGWFLFARYMYGHTDTCIPILWEVNRVNVLHLNLFNFVRNLQGKNNWNVILHGHFLKFWSSIKVPLKYKTLTLFTSHKIGISVSHARLFSIGFMFFMLPSAYTLPNLSPLDLEFQVEYQT